MAVDRRRRRVLLGAFVVLAILATAVLSEVLATVFFAVTVAYVLYPVRQLVRHRGWGRRVSAGVATLVGFLAVVIAALPIVGALYARRLTFVTFVSDLPPEIPVSAFGVEFVVDVSVVRTRAQTVLTDVAVDLAAAAPVIALKTALFVLLVYALLWRPHEIRATTFELVPSVYHDIVEGFHRRVRDTLYAIYVLQAATAFGTFLIAYVVFAVLGYESTLVLAVLAGILQFIPIVGPSVLVIVLGIYQVTLGNPGAAVLVVAFGLVLVGFFPDALIRPRLATYTAGMPGSLYFVGFTGGVLTVGIVGFIAGPLAVAVLLEAGQQLSTEMGVEPAPPDD
ncbi:AI-2E family transporter [Halorientalis pallida]|uniref:AI-2E family transporter n=1 Tax=Halorientalis pallida TaxID=2479928 RepID=A0A498L3D6_9EURY|nr:AI-2E family transporter [Halorientalis pallida]RXK50304.1 AI-2E family transporter [Halorientalis pallida]